MVANEAVRLIPAANEIPLFGSNGTGYKEMAVRLYGAQGQNADDLGRYLENVTAQKLFQEKFIYRPG